MIEAAITPCVFPDHHGNNWWKQKITSRSHYYWHFKKKLLYDTLFLVRNVSLYGSSGSYKNIFLKIKVNGGRLKKHT